MITLAIIPSSQPLSLTLDDNIPVATTVVVHSGLLTLDTSFADVVGGSTKRFDIVITLEPNNPFFYIPVEVQIPSFSGAATGNFDAVGTTPSVLSHIGGGFGVTTVAASAIQANGLVTQFTFADLTVDP